MFKMGKCYAFHLGNAIIRIVGNNQFAASNPSKLMIQVLFSTMAIWYSFCFLP